MGLSNDPSFIAEVKEEEGAAQGTAKSVVFDSIYEHAAVHPRLLNILPVCKNFGLGIVKSVDLWKNEVVIMTPLDEATIQQVNTLIRSTQPLPQSFYNDV